MPPPFWRWMRGIRLPSSLGAAADESSQIGLVRSPCRSEPARRPTFSDSSFPKGGEAGSLRSCPLLPHLGLLAPDLGRDSFRAAADGLPVAFGHVGGVEEACNKSDAVGTGSKEFKAVLFVDTGSRYDP